MTGTRARTGAGVKLYIGSAAVADEDMNLAAFEDVGITWIRINGTTDVGEGGVTSNSSTQSFLGDDEIDDVSKTTDTPNTVPVTISRREGDAGQEALRTAAAGRLNWIFKVDRNDSPDEVEESSIEYMRGQVGKAGKPRGGAGDYHLERYNIFQRQAPVENAPAAS